VSRRNNRAPEFYEPVEIESDPWQLEAQAREMRERAEEQFRAALDRLPPEERTAFWNAKFARKRRRERNIARTQFCQLPGCIELTAKLAGRSLGVCDWHAMQCAQWFAIVTDEHEQEMLKASVISARIHRERKASKDEAKRLERKRNEPGWIYYVLVGERVKIGWTTDVKKRLLQYPPDSPLLAMHPGTKATERDMHVKFAGSRAAGREWFLDTPELRRHIDDVIAQFGEPDRARYERRGRMGSGLRAAPPKPTGISR
jgi:hypothetical protein